MKTSRKYLAQYPVKMKQFHKRRIKISLIELEMLLINLTQNYQLAKTQFYGPMFLQSLNLKERSPALTVLALPSFK